MLEYNLSIGFEQKLFYLGDKNYHNSKVLP